MRLRTPRWWHQPRTAKARVAAAALSPLGALWAAATVARLRRARPFDPGAPVICVGNLTVGGSGKTPLAIALAERLGPGTHILARGYGGRARGPLLVDPGRHTAEQVGDEALLLAASAPTWIGADRSLSARAAVNAGARLLVMDDGHQNGSLEKALAILAVDGETRGEWPFGREAVFPAGPLREPLDRGLARADAVVVLLPADLAQPDAALIARLDGPPVLVARLAPCAPPPPGPQLAFAGIAKPWRFAQALRAAGCELEGFVALADHAPVGASRLQALQRRADALGAGLLTTEKDWVRLPPAWRRRVRPWRVRVEFEDEAALRALLGAVQAPAFSANLQPA